MVRPRPFGLAVSNLAGKEQWPHRIAAFVRHRMPGEGDNGPRPSLRAIAQAVRAIGNRTRASRHRRNHGWGSGRRQFDESIASFPLRFETPGKGSRPGPSGETLITKPDHGPGRTWRRRYLTTEAIPLFERVRDAQVKATRARGHPTGNATRSITWLCAYKKGIGTRTSSLRHRSPPALQTAQMVDRASEREC